MCRFAYGLADATATQSLASVKSRLVFTFLVPAHLGIPGQRAVKRVCVCVCVCNAYFYSSVAFAVVC